MDENLREKLAKHLPFAVPVTAFSVGSGWALWTLHAAIAQPGFPAPDGISAFGLAGFSTLTGGLFAAAAHHISGMVEARLAHFFPPQDPLTVTYSMPEWPAETPEIRLILGESHGQLKAGYSRKPGWYTLPALGLYTGSIAFGATGSAKTAGVIRPALDQLIGHASADPDRKAGGLIMDAKASLVAPTAEAAAACNRTADLLLIGPAHPVKWNPIHAPDLEPRVLAARLIAVLENLAGQSSKGDTAWIADGTGSLIEHGIGLLRQSTGYVTLVALYQFLTGLQAALSSADPDDPPPATAVAYLEPFQKLFDTNASKSETDKQTFAWHVEHFARVFAPQDARFRGIYISEFARIVKDFTDPKFADLYSPSEKDIDFVNFSDAIQTGKIVVLDANADLYGPVAKVLGICLKLDFQTSMLARPSLHRQNSACNLTRPMLLIIDEYQEFVTVGGNAGDQQFVALSRESKAIPLFATQSRASLIQKVGEDKVRTLLASLRTKIFLALTDPQDLEFAAKICGEQWGQVENVNVSESVQQAGLAAAGRLVGKDSTVSESRSLNSQKINNFEPSEFYSLPVFTAVVAGFDGKTALPPQRVLLKPYFRPKTETYREFTEGVGHA